MSKHTHMDAFIASCTETELKTVLRYIQAQKMDQLDNILASASPIPPFSKESPPLYRMQILIKRLRIPQSRIAACIGKTDRTVRNKLVGKQDFTVKEARAVRDCFFPYETLDSLLEEVSNAAADAAFTNGDNARDFPKAAQSQGNAIQHAGKQPVCPKQEQLASPPAGAAKHP